MATDYGAQGVFDYLLAKGADVNSPALETGMTPLVRAIGHNRTYMVQRLLSAGASAKQDPTLSRQPRQPVSGQYGPDVRNHG